MTASARLSGPPRRVLTGNLRDFSLDPLKFLTETSNQFGPVASLRFGRMRAFLVSDPGMIEEILVKRRNDFVKAAAIRKQRKLFGSGLLINEGNSWARQRRLTQPAFHPGNLGVYVQPILDHTRRALDRWKTTPTIDVHEEMKDLLMSIAAECLFGPEVAPEAARIGAAVEAAMDQYASRRGAARLLPEWIPLEETRRYIAGVKELDEFVAETVARRRESKAERKDLLGMLLAARDENGSSMSPRQLRDEAINLFVGAFDTPSLTMSWTWYLLALHREIADRLHEESDNAVPGETSTMPFTQLVLRESMRLYPPAYLLGREAIRDTQLGDANIPRGSTVLISQWVMHRHPSYFERPLDFIPERWKNQPSLPRFVYFPFGAGPRVCIGAALATLELTLVLSMIAREMRFELVSNEEIVPHATMTLRPRGGVHARVTRR
ncbi:MAG TPA: cytochrome P450 [Gemmatimonadaceae bacterium]